MTPLAPRLRIRFYCLQVPCIYSFSASYSLQQFLTDKNQRKTLGVRNRHVSTSFRVMFLKHNGSKTEILQARLNCKVQLNYLP